MPSPSSAPPPRLHPLLLLFCNSLLAQDSVKDLAGTTLTTTDFLCLSFHFEIVDGATHWAPGLCWELGEATAESTARYLTPGVPGAPVPGPGTGGTRDYLFRGFRHAEVWCPWSKHLDDRMSFWRRSCLPGAGAKQLGHIQEGGKGGSEPWLVAGNSL